jgi:hypothetical protein
MEEPGQRTRGGHGGAVALRAAQLAGHDAQGRGLLSFT